MLQRWQGPGFTCVRVINMMDFVLTYLGNSLVPFYCLFYGLSIRVSGYISRLNLTSITAKSSIHKYLNYIYIIVEILTKGLVK